jgi:hypothetical protein
MHAWSNIDHEGSDFAKLKIRRCVSILATMKIWVREYRKKHNNGAETVAAASTPSIE